MKKFFSLSLALLLCAALSVPAFAVERAVPSVAEGLAPVQVTLNQGGGSYDLSDSAEKTFDVESPMVLDSYYDHTVDDFVEAYPVESYVAVSRNSTFTVRHNGKAGDGSFITVSLDSYVYEDGTRNHYDWDGGAYLVNAGYFVDDALDPDVPKFGGLVKLTAGQSVTFSVSFDSNVIDGDDLDGGKLNDGDKLVMLRVSIVYPELDYSYWGIRSLRLDEKNAAVKPQPSASAFSDVAAGAYYADAVKWAVEKGITAGTTATTFSPNNTCTTAQILTFLWRANGSPAPTGNNAAVPAGQYYTDAANWALEKGLTDNFNADTPATRAATVTYLWKLAGKPAAEAAAFTDVDAGAEYAQAVAWAVKKGVTAGTSATTFAPGNTCTRGQIVTFLHRSLA